jgi:lysophospholipase L1-like esterase
VTSSWKQRGGALLFGILLITAIEGTLRLAGFDSVPEEAPFRFVGPELEMAEFVRDPILFWRIRPDSPEIAVSRAVARVNNSMGFRGPLVDAVRTTDAGRVAFLGDSCTYGVGVGLRESYVGRLGPLLERATGRPVELVNTGCPGYSSYQGLKMLETEILPLHPDVVTVYFGNWNDFVPAIGGDDEDKGRRLSPPGWASGLERDASRLRLFVAVQHAWVRILGAGDPEFGRRARDEYIEAFKRGAPPEGRRVPPERFRLNLLAMVRICRANGITPIFISPPLSKASQLEFPIYLEYRRIVQGVAEEQAVPLAPAAEELGSREAVGEAVYQDWVHPNAAGHAVIADVLAPLVGAALNAERGAD